jgi:hypothetical protein
MLLVPLESTDLELVEIYFWRVLRVITAILSLRHPCTLNHHLVVVTDVVVLGLEISNNIQVGKLNIPK